MELFNRHSKYKRTQGRPKRYTIHSHYFVVHINLYSHRTSITDQAGGFPTPEENHNVRVCANEYSNNFFIAEYNAGRAQTTLRNRTSRPPSSYSQDGNNSGTVPSRNCQKWKDPETNEKQQNGE
ncbi:uncharacterized protein TNCV_4928561 [Trichonephila clavipes]|nr:uncharacterized protein TNCV_4928561 [Trichonephila clavipes]